MRAFKKSFQLGKVARVWIGQWRPWEDYFGFGLDRPGAEIAFSVSLHPYMTALNGIHRRFYARRQTSGFYGRALWFKWDIRIEWPVLLKQAHPCHKCGRLWPADIVGLRPGDPRWDNVEWVAVHRDAWRGEWESLYTFDKKLDEYVYGPLVWRGPCCISYYPDEFDEEEEPDYDEYWDDEDDIDDYEGSNEGIDVTGEMMDIAWDLQDEPGPEDNVN